eukprot:CAMPEP_0197317282 /NCGR_PEP_ID=MMETSP0891-20130614/46270_1 /TAXON_ID=44058 ORGANISM="Aureoumbra lagunensis, Strain CCMP1510" /NCGR_SAMPLE_ID=MMETSP0891 /ASSEMBLY_ACC=CAM_ASM_000534 /LENGTH=424 /DNA_ID=CAMNT_0042807183 /DNA_START=3 /DNA_END=1277 /DNA_ORIENTATION=-
MASATKEALRSRIEYLRSEIDIDKKSLSDGQLRRAKVLGYGASSEGWYDEEEDDDDIIESKIINKSLRLNEKMLTSIVIPRNIDILQLRSLIALSLRKNCLRSLEAHTLAPLAALEFLDVAENELERLCPIGTALTAPQESDEIIESDSEDENELSPNVSEWIRTHPGPQTLTLCSFPPRLRSLDASRNRISRCSIGSGGAPCLERINLSHNKIRFISQDLKGAPHLLHLDLRFNLLPQQNLSQFKHFAHLRKLRALALNGNVIAKDPRYKLKLCAVAPNLRYALDHPQYLNNLATDYFSDNTTQTNYENSHRHKIQAPIWPRAASPTSQLLLKNKHGEQAFFPSAPPSRRRQSLSPSSFQKNDQTWPDVGALARSIWSSSPRQAPPRHPPTPADALPPHKLATNCLPAEEETKSFSSSFIDKK